MKRASFDPKHNSRLERSPHRNRGDLNFESLLQPECLVQTGHTGIVLFKVTVRRMLCYFQKFHISRIYPLDRYHSTTEEGSDFSVSKE